MTYQRFDATKFRERHDIKDQRFDDVCAVVAPAKNGPWLVGGSVRRLISRTPQDSDFDLAFPSQAALEACATRLKGSGFKQVRATDEHVEMIGKVGDDNTTVQLLKVVFAETPELVVDSFDFTICQFAFDGADIICGPYSLWDLGRERLAIHKVTYGAATVRRLVKYTKQGFRCCQGTAVQLLEQIVANPQNIRGDVQYVD